MRVFYRAEAPAEYCRTGVNDRASTRPISVRRRDTPDAVIAHRATGPPVVAGRARVILVVEVEPGQPVREEPAHSRPLLVLERLPLSAV